MVKKGCQIWPEDEGEQILADRTPPRPLVIFKKRLCRMDDGSTQMVYVYFHNRTYPRDFPGTEFLINVQGLSNLT